MTFEIAKREAVPMMISIAGTSGSGKTYSALLMAAGLAGKNGKVGLIDSELGRGSMYADDVEIMNAMPNNQYLIKQITEPFSPAKYASAIKEAIAAGVTVLVIDSISHEWEGSGGCQDIAENNKLRGMPNWAKAKMEHKKLMNLVTQSPIHIIFCLRAREKTKPMKVVENGKQTIEMVQEGLQAIQEKNFMFEMTMSMMMDFERPGEPKLTKCPKPLIHVIGEEGGIITKKIGEKLKDWSDGGAGIDLEIRNLKREFREAAACGSDTLSAIHNRLKTENLKLLKRIWNPDFAEEMKSLAKEADNLSAETANQNELNSEPQRLNFDSQPD